MDEKWFRNKHLPALNVIVKKFQNSNENKTNKKHSETSRGNVSDTLGGRPRSHALGKEFQRVLKWQKKSILPLFVINLFNTEKSSGLLSPKQSDHNLKRATKVAAILF